MEKLKLGEYTFSIKNLKIGTDIVCETLFRHNNKKEWALYAIHIDDKYESKKEITEKIKTKMIKKMKEDINKYNK